MIEGKAVDSAVERNNANALIIETNVQEDGLHHGQAWQPMDKGAFEAASVLATFRQITFTVTKYGVKMLLCLVAGFILFVTIMVLSVYAFYLKLKQDRKN